jgi:hypothetical protein
MVVGATFLAALALVNPHLTPGAVRPLSVATICATRWGLDVRHVDASLRARVFAAYGIPANDRGLYVIDHLIPRELAGADVFANLWPERKEASRIKDRQENALHVALCAPAPLITLETAQERMRHWSSE